MSRIHNRYYEETGETVAQAVARLHKSLSVQLCAEFIGYATSTDLRKYLRRRGVADPWPVAKARGRCNPIPPEILAVYKQRIAAGKSSRQAGAGLPFDHHSLRNAAKR